MERGRVSCALKKKATHTHTHTHIIKKPMGRGRSKIGVLLDELNAEQDRGPSMGGMQLFGVEFTVYTSLSLALSLSLSSLSLFSLFSLSLSLSFFSLSYLNTKIT